MPELMCQPVVRQLLRAGMSYPEQEALAKYLESQADPPIWDSALVWTPELRGKYWQAMVELQKELVPKYTNMQDLYRKLWGLFREVVLNKANLQSGTKLQEKIDDFSKEVKKPLITFNVIYEIRDFSIGERYFTLGNVEVFNLTADYLKSLGLTRSHIISEWEGRSVAKVEVDASEPDRALDSGEIEVNNILNILRLAVRRERIGEVYESIYWWELGENIVIPKKRPEVGTLWTVGSGRHERPLIIELGETVAKVLEDESVWKYILDEKLPKDISIRMQRAIEWISHSITSKSLDYKLVDLCTALEIMLLPNHKRGLKGELIALRQVLIGQGSSYAPAGILYLYEKRSNIIHSGALEITNYLDYWHLLICCLQVLESIVRLSQRYPDKWEMEDLLSIVENKETLENFIRYCELGMYEGKGINKIKKAAEERLAQCQ